MTTTPNAIADRITEILSANDMGARVWDKSGIRVYVSRDLSRRAQDMGYIEVDEETGERNYNGLERRRAGIRDIVEAAPASA